MAIWVIKDGQREGPYEEQDLRELVYEGTYTEADSAIRDGQYDWTTLGRILGRQPPPPLATTLEPPPMPAAFPPAAPLVAPPPVAAAPVQEPPPVPAAYESAAPAEQPPGQPVPTQVTVTDFDMPFSSMVILMVKWALASIPALIILGVIVAGCWIAFFAFIALVARH